MGLSRRTGTRVSAAAAITIAALVAVLASPSAALAASFSAKAPLAGSVVAAGTSKVSVSVWDAAGVRGAASFWMTVDGARVKASIKYSKRGDYRRFKLTYAPAGGLAAGPHSVTAGVRNRKGRAYTSKWKFSVAVPMAELATALLQVSPPVAPPTGAADVASSYVGTATIHLSAGPGERVFYSLDAEPAREGTVVVVAPPATGSVIHSLKFMVVDAAGNAGAPMVSFFTVSAPPVAPLADTAAPVTVSDAHGVYSGTATISLFATDDGAGQVRTFWRLDGGPINEGTVVVVPAPEAGIADHSLEFWSVDAAGNEETHRSTVFMVEADMLIIEPPVIADGPCVVSGCHPTNVVTVHEAVGACQVCHAPGVTPSLDCETCHELESLTESHDFLPPLTHSDVTDSYVGTATVRLWAMDRSNRPLAQVIGAGVAATYYRLDGGPLVETLPPLWNGVDVIVAPPAQGVATHTLEYWSVDVYGNAEAPSAAAFTVEADPPVIIVPPAPIWDLQPSYTGTATIHLFPPAGFVAYYQVDGGVRRTGSLIVVTPPASGTVHHVLTVTLVDTAGNAMSTKSGAFSITAPYVAPADTLPPVTACLVTEGLTTAANTYVGPIVVSLRIYDPADKGRVRTYSRLDGGDAVEGLSVAVPAPATGVVSHTLEYWSVDPAGNVEAPKTFSFTVGPTPSWVLNHVGPYTTSYGEGVYHGTATIRLAASDPDGPGVAHTYYRLDGGPAQEGTLITVEAPETGSQGHSILFWSVDLDGVAESPCYASFTVYAE